MKMDDGEIIREYKAGINKNNMVTVLADRNCCTRKEMAQWLKDHGQEVDKRILNKGTAKKAQEEKFEEILDSVDAGKRAEVPEVPNQEAKADAGKPRLSLVPMQILYDIAVIREYGCNKYPDGGPENWKQVKPERYRDAMLRHMIAYIQDPQSVDNESGLKHLAHMACNIAFLCELEGKK